MEERIISLAECDVDKDILAHYAPAILTAVAESLRPIRSFVALENDPQSNHTLLLLDQLLAQLKKGEEMFHEDDRSEEEEELFRQGWEEGLAQLGKEEK